MRKGRGGFGFIGLAGRRRGLRCGGYAREDRRRRPNRTVARCDLSTFDMRAQPTIIALERGLTPKALRTDIALGAAASAWEKAAREEKVESTPSAGTTCGRLCARR